MPTWMQALQEYKKEKGKFVIPKKGTAAYARVIQLMGSAKPKAPKRKPANKK
jgi:hypothetical protein